MAGGALLPAEANAADMAHTGEALDWLERQETASVDMFLFDPPYSIPAKIYESTHNYQRHKGDWGIMLGYFGRVFREMSRVLRPNGFLYCFCNCDSYPIFWEAALPCFRRVSTLVWVKPNSHLGMTWRKQHEFILYAHDCSGFRTGKGDVIVENELESVLRAAPVKHENRLHPAQKPIPLLKKIIAHHFPDGGGVICDPFAGSGSTGVAARECGCEALLVELNPAQYMEKLGV